MGEPIFGVVPNFSEGRRVDVMDAICDALQVPGARLVYRQADGDHNRLDTTVLGSRDGVHRAAVSAARVAAGLIDMEHHRGGHPRMGATDVIPFMPVRDVEMVSCVELAREVGAELADALDLPVYLYDQAALIPERASLAVVRKGEYEGLRDAVAKGERLPDLGPHAIGSAGATAVGARVPLVAFNAYLTAAEADAKEIARTIRGSGGGLPALRAIGFLVPERGCSTVSMNLVDYTTTGVRAAYDAVVAQAEARGAEVLDTEIVGLVPEAALSPEDAEYVRLVGFDREAQVLERLIEEAP
ncbi:MAG TPA: glutamate formimidoyltransferase [Actinomycetota bacterium]|nr:glutamate formimidoyltransferase [Actinomycetota bacterium]